MKIQRTVEIEFSDEDVQELVLDRAKELMGAIPLGFRVVVEKRYGVWRGELLKNEPEVKVVLTSSPLSDDSSKPQSVVPAAPVMPF